jgi:PKD repeat protein
LKRKILMIMLLILQLTVVNAITIHPAFSTTTPTLQVEPNTYTVSKLQPDEIFKVNVTINNLSSDSEAVFVQFRLQYNSSLLEPVDVTEGPFLNGSAWAPQDTLFVSYIENDPIFKSNVLVGDMILPNATGYWSAFPSGNGTIATITFKAKAQPTIEPNPPASCPLQLIDTKIFNDDGVAAQQQSVSGLYTIEPMKHPLISVTYMPLKPSIGEPTVFDASGSYDPLYTIANYTWNFGDGTNVTTTLPTTAHIYSQLGQYTATLTVTNTYGLTNTTTMTVNVGIYTPLDVSIDTGSLQFKGETAEFNILTTETGKPVNATELEAKLYFNGQLLQDLTNNIQFVSEGLYRTSYNIPSTAQTGTYTLMVTAKYYDVQGASIKTFQISPTLTVWAGQITDITNGIATVTNDVETLTLNLTQVNATLTGLITNSKGEILAAISTTAGNLTATLNTINATITEVNGNNVTMSTTLGDIKTKLDGTVTTMLYVATILSAIAVILALAILIFMRKK